MLITISVRVVGKRGRPGKRKKNSNSNQRFPLQVKLMFLRLLNATSASHRIRSAEVRFATSIQ